MCAPTYTDWTRKVPHALLFQCTYSLIIDLLQVLSSDLFFKHGFTSWHKKTAAKGLWEHRESKSKSKTAGVARPPSNPVQTLSCSTTRPSPPEASHLNLPFTRELERIIDTRLWSQWNSGAIRSFSICCFFGASEVEGRLSSHCYPIIIRNKLQKSLG